MALLIDGFSTTVAFDSDSDVKLYEKSVMAPGIDAGGAIDITTMRNATWRTFAAKSLKTLSEASMTVSYDGSVYSEIILLLGVTDKITVTFPDGGTFEFHGFLNTFSPGSAEEGEQPEADCSIVITNATEAGVETPPVYVAG